MEPIEFKSLPGFSNLFLDYVSENGEDLKKLENFFFANYREKSELFKVIDAKSHNYSTNRYFDRNILIDILKRQNISLGGTEQTAASIELLKEDNTFAVVTGQQVGLYTGNMYTILKSVTAIKLARELSVKFPDFNFVPVFWLESEDHDIDESNHIHLINKQNELVRIGFEETVQDTGEVPRKSSVPVGSIAFDASIAGINGELSNALMETGFKESLMSNVNAFYAEGSNYTQSFVRFMNWIFGEYGLVFINPGDPEIKKLLTPVFERELTTSPKLCETVITTSAELEKSYDLQVKPKVINLFFIHNGNRLLIEPRDNNRFALRGSKRRFEADELMNTLFENPEAFSPNVVLRPICQDYLLPTVAYVGGPSEISYFAQFKPVYEHYDITMPAIFPRVSVTVLEKKISKFLSNFEVGFKDVFHRKMLVSKVVDKLSEIKIDDGISRAQDEFGRIFYDLKTMTTSVDRTLLNTLDNVKERLNTGVEMFKAKLINAQAAKSETATKQIEKVLNNLYPAGSLQERVINISYFLNKYGTDFIKKLFDEVDINVLQHQVIDV